MVLLVNCQGPSFGLNKQRKIFVQKTIFARFKKMQTKKIQQLKEDVASEVRCSVVVPTIAHAIQEAVQNSKHEGFIIVTPTRCRSQCQAHSN